jgi:hypothetical protein
VSFAAITLCVASQRAFVTSLRRSPETFGYTLVCSRTITVLVVIGRPLGLEEEFVSF